jgi:hypothetical protein
MVGCLLLKHLYNLADEPWVNNGAAVRVSLVCFGVGNREAVLNGQPVECIHADLSAGAGLDLTLAQGLKQNLKVSFEGVQKNGPFDVAGDMARQWLQSPNPTGKPNSQVLRPYANASDITGRYSDQWMIDFDGCSEADAMLYEQPFEYVHTTVKPVREAKREAYLAQNVFTIFSKGGPKTRDGRIAGWC